MIYPRLGAHAKLEGETKKKKKNGGGNETVDREASAYK